MFYGQIIQNFFIGKKSDIKNNRDAIMIAYVKDEDLKKKENSRGENYWDVYIEEILDLTGSQGLALSLNDLNNINKLSSFYALIIGSVSGKYLSKDMIKTIEIWVKNGGLLIGFMPDGLDDIFGIVKNKENLKQKDDYTVNGKFELIPSWLSRELHPVLMMQQKLLIISDISRIAAKDGTIELAHLYDNDEEYMDCPAITWHKYGQGFAAYFGFDVAKTVWLLHQGKPVPESKSEERYPKTRNLCILENNSRQVCYADEIVFLVQNMLSQTNQPFIYQIPPDVDGKIPDALFYWSGDEYRGPTEHSLFASDFMYKLGLPMHINIEVERHPMTREEYDHIVKRNGHEISAYWQLYPKDNYDVKREHILKQADEFRQRFGKSPGSTLLWSTKWKGWTEPARWMAEAGATADNSISNKGVRYTIDDKNGRGTKYHHYANVGNYSFSGGTAFPFHFYEDFNYSNKKIPDFIEQPLVCYETGNHSSLRPEPDLKTLAPEDVHLPIDRAVKYHQVINWFYHPIGIATKEAPRAAIQEIVRYIKYLGANVLHMGADAAAEWWLARSKSKVKITNNEHLCFSLEYECTYSGGMIIKFKNPVEGAFSVSMDNVPWEYEIKEEFGQKWLFVVVPYGKGAIKITKEIQTGRRK